MGFFDTIKSVYKKADTAVGGYLPGGSTPSEVSASKTSSVQQADTNVPQTQQEFISALSNEQPTSQSLDTGVSTRYTPSAPAVSNVQPTSSYSSGSSSRSYSSGSSSRNTSSSVTSPPVGEAVNSVSPQLSSGEPAYRVVQIENKDGTTSAFKVDPNYSVKSQTGSYEHDFFSVEGQKERALNALETMGPRTTGTLINGEQVNPAVSYGITGVTDALNVAAILYGGATAFKTMASWGKLGQMAMTPGGAKTIAGSTKSAAGFLSTEGVSGAGKLGGVFSNSKTAATEISFAKKALAGVKDYKTLLGLSIGGLGYQSISGEVNEAPKLVTTLGEIGAIKNKLREAGMNDMADELDEKEKDLKDGLETWTRYIPFFGRAGLAKTNNDAVLVLDKSTNAYEQMVRDDTTHAETINQKIRMGDTVSQADLERAAKTDPNGEANDMVIAQSQASYNKDSLIKQQKLVVSMMGMSPQDIVNSPEVLLAVNDPANADSLIVQQYMDAKKSIADAQEAEAQRLYNAQKLADERAYDEYREAEQRAYDEEQEAEDRAYEEELAGIQRADEQFAEDTATETSQASSLNFGLLNSSGAKEFVNRETASQAYFEKAYVELTPAQKKLLNLLKK